MLGKNRRDFLKIAALAAGSTSVGLGTSAYAATVATESNFPISQEECGVKLHP